MGEKGTVLDKKKIFSQEHRHLAVFLLCLAGLVLLVLAFGARSYHLPIFDGSQRVEEPGWYFGEKGTELQPTELSDKHWIEPGKVYLLTTELVYNGQGDDYPCAFFTVGNYQVKVFLDGEEMFRYTRQERGYPRIQGMGGAAFSVPLGKNCQGKVLTLELSTSMKYAFERRMPGITLGDHAAQMHHMFITNLPGMLISTAIFFVAFVLVLLGNASTRKRWAYLHFAVFALIIVVYRGSQDLFIMYHWANPVVSVTLEFFSLVFCPLPVLLSYRSELKPRYETVFDILIAITSLNIIAQLILHFTGIRDVVQMLTPTHLWVGIASVILVVLALRARQQDPQLHCLRKLVPILAGAVLDFATFYIRIHTIGAGSFFVVGNFIGLGLLVSLSLLVWEARKERENAQLAAQRNKILERVAYEDGLTGIANRAAFTKAFAKLQNQDLQEKSLRIVMADLNDLKLVNDSLGHTAGDALICRAADLLEDCFRKYGTVYRTGGDEFCAILENVSDAQWEQLRSCLYGALEQRNQDQPSRLSIAMGSMAVEGSIEKALQTADQRMYQDKVRIKSDRASYPASTIS